MSKLAHSNQKTMDRIELESRLDDLLDELLAHVRHTFDQPLDGSLRDNMKATLRAYFD